MRNIRSTNLFDTSIRKRFFFGKSKKSAGRPGALMPESIQSKIEKIGLNKKVIVQRVDYDGDISDSTPIVVTSINKDGFSGYVVNVDREVREGTSRSAEIFVEGGGGSISFHFQDGDIASVEEDIDNDIIEQKDKTEILEILEALDPGDGILVSYYDKDSGGFKNGFGNLADKNMDEETMSFDIHILNEIKLSEPLRVNLDLKKDMILDLQIQF
jgi:hypothetical protein